MNTLRPRDHVGSFAGSSLLAMMLIDKYANRQPLDRQSEQYGARASSCRSRPWSIMLALAQPLYELIKAHVFPDERIHGNDTTADLDLCPCDVQ